MMKRPSSQARYLILILAVCLTGWVRVSSNEPKANKLRSIPPLPKEAFSPSNARTEDGGLIAVDQFFSAKRCLACHQDTHAAWSESLHRNAAREPFYRESADILLRTRGIEFTRHCESCHTPVALFSGALTTGAPRQEAPFTALDDEGVTCSVCHSITGARLNGTGSFTIRRPALLAKEDGTPIFGDILDEEILADVAGHRRAVMRPLLRQPEFCATCHKVDAPPDLNGYKHIRGFSAYDEWQQSGASHEVVSPYYRTRRRVDCRGCHMPKIGSFNDRAARNGLISSHQWLGANTAAPLFYGQTKQVERTKEFLSSQVINADIFALKRESTGETLHELTTKSRFALVAGEEITAEVVIANRKAAHSFAPEVRDLYEIWVEFEALDDEGLRLMHSGLIKPDGMLDESAHVYKAILLDEDSRPITRHQIWLTNVVGYNNAIPAGRSDVARFRFRLPTNWRGSGTIALRATVNYRRFTQEYTNYVLKRQKRELTIPIVRMAESEVRIHPSSSESISTKDGLARKVHFSSEMRARRWNDYGIALLEQAQYGPAAEAFRRASELNPTDLDPLISAAIAEMRTERFGPEQSQLFKAAKLLQRVLKLDPANARASYVHAVLLRSQNKPEMAAQELARVAQEYPRDREVARQLGQTLYTLGQIAEARRAFETILEVDPTDFGAYQFLSPIYQSEGDLLKANYAGALFLQWRDDPTASAIARRFFAAHPQWAEERVLAHTHEGDSPPRPVLSGLLAAPER